MGAKSSRKNTAVLVVILTARCIRSDRLIMVETPLSRFSVSQYSDFGTNCKLILITTIGYTSTTCRTPGKPSEPSFTIIGNRSWSWTYRLLGCFEGAIRLPGFNRVPPVPPLQSTSGGLRNCPHSEARQRVAADQ